MKYLEMAENQQQTEGDSAEQSILKTKGERSCLVHSVARVKSID